MIFIRDIKTLENKELYFSVAIFLMRGIFVQEERFGRMFIVDMKNMTS